MQRALVGVTDLKEQREIYAREAAADGRFTNDDLLSVLTLEDIERLKLFKEVWPQIVLMQTTFGKTAEERLYFLLKSAVDQWPNIRVAPVMDDNDKEGRDGAGGKPGILQSMASGRLHEYQDRIILTSHAFHGTNLGRKVSRGVRAVFAALSVIAVAGAIAGYWLGLGVTVVSLATLLSSMLMLTDSGRSCAGSTAGSGSAAL